MVDDDNDLISRCLKNDPAAEYELYHRFAPKMFGICLRYGGNEKEAEDILQNGFIRLYSRLHQFKKEGNLGAWVERIFVTTAINYYRKNLKYGRNVEYTDNEPYSTVQEGVLSAMSAKEVLAVIQGLPLGCRTVFNMHVIENYEHKEIAESLGISVGTSKSQLSRAKCLIRQRLGDRDKLYSIASFSVMEEQDPVDNRFREAVSGFEKEPPARVWEHVNLKLHPLHGPSAVWKSLLKFSLLADMPVSFYLAVSGAALGLFLTIVYFGSSGHHAVRGHAYAGPVRLSAGSAALFRVEDKAMPWDSVTHFRSANIDRYGHFQFSGVPEANYLLRIAPDRNSETGRNYMPTWFDRHETADSCRLIIMHGSDINLDPCLLKVSGGAKQPGRD